ncbi:MAG TPA: hypothetical protein VF605_08490 [Allosphingosinicella sp.]|jgi:hypothetical protein
MPAIPVASDLDIYLATSRASAERRGIDGPTVIIVPDAGDWNDFGARMPADLHVLGIADAGAPLRMRLLIEGDERTRSYVVDQLGVGEAVGGRARRRPVRKSLFQDRIMWIRLAGAAGFEPANAGTKNRTEPTEGRRNPRPIKSLAD